jgi:3-oxoacyl-[acyl-carrier-protein] synthase-3
LGSQGDFGQLLSVPGGGSREPLTPEGLQQGRQYMRMDGRAVFKWAVRIVCDMGHDVVRHAELAMDDIDLVVMHQANLRIIEAAAEGLGIDRRRVLVNVDRYGNTTAASVPLVLDEALSEGRLKRGDHVLLLGFGAGLTWGAGVLRY